MTLTLAGKLLWLVSVIGWYVIRYPFERRAKRARVSQSRRFLAETVRMAWSFSGLGLIPGLWVFSGIPHFADYRPHPTQMILGAASVVLALVLFRKTHKALGKMWSVSLDIRDGHQLVTSGIYRKLRHPMYSAFWSMALAQALLLPNWIAGPAGLVGFGTLFFLRIGDEERMMEAEFGDAYRAYKKRTDRILPGIF